MKPRATPLRIEPAWPFVPIRVRDQVWTFKVSGGPVERSELYRWFHATPMTAYTEAVAARSRLLAADPSDKPALAVEALAAEDASLAAAEGSAGWMIVALWHHPDLALDARDAYDRGDYRGEHAKRDCGRAAVAELLAHGLDWEDVEDLARAVAGLLVTQRPDATRRAEVLPFGVATTSPTS